MIRWSIREGNIFPPDEVLQGLIENCKDKETVPYEHNGITFLVEKFYGHWGRVYIQKKGASSQYVGMFTWGYKAEEVRFVTDPRKKNFY